MSSTDGREQADEIKDNLDIVDVIGKDIELTHAGNGQYTGAIKASSQSGASLIVDRTQQIYNDFAGGGGDVYNWIADQQGLDYKADFPEVLRIAAEMAGIELNAGDTERYREKAAVHETLTKVTEYYHKQLTDEHYAFLLNQWGITKETVDRYKYFFMPDCENLVADVRGLATPEELKLTGMCFDNYKPALAGRLVFPYWINGKVVYSAGRAIDGVTKGDITRRKYVKSLTHGEKFPFVSEHIKNDVLYGVDSLRGAEYCIITEGVTDCIALIQAGFPCISPVTTQFPKAVYEKLINTVRRFKDIYVSNDSEDPKDGKEHGAGKAGALKTLELLQGAGISAKFVELPRPDGIDKMDVAEYLKTHASEDFKTLMVQAKRLHDIEFEDVVDGLTDDIEDNIGALQHFIDTTLKPLPEALAIAFINTHFKKVCDGVNSEVIKSFIKGMVKQQKTEASQAKKEQEGDDKQRIVDQLIGYAVDGAVLFHDAVEVPFAYIDGECMAVNGDKFAQRIRHGFFKDAGGAPNGETLNTAVATIASQAIFNGERHELHNRVCQHEDAFYWDCGDNRAVKIDKGTWEMVDTAPILFRRFKQQKPLDVELLAVGKGNVRKILNHVNIKDKEGKLLFIIDLIVKMVPDIGHALVIVTGDQGAAKSTLGKTIKALIDPSVLEMSSLPNQAKELVQVLDHNYIVNFDNVTRINQEQSDILCRGVTGDYVSKRTLFTDDGDHIARYQVPIVINGITNVAERPDLLDRALLIELERVPSADRKTEKEFWEAFNKDKAEILTGIFDTVAKAKKLIDDGFDIDNKARMADYELWGCAVCKALGRPHKEFREAYAANRDERNTDALEMSPIGRVLLLVATIEHNPVIPFRGSATDLYTLLKEQCDKYNIPTTRADGFPQGVPAMSAHMKRINTNLLDEGIKVTWVKSGHRIITIEKVEKINKSDSGNTPPTPSNCPDTPETQTRDGLYCGRGENAPRPPRPESTNKNTTKQNVDGDGKKDRPKHESKTHAVDGLESANSQRRPDRLNKTASGGIMDGVDGVGATYPPEKIKNKMHISDGVTFAELKKKTIAPCISGGCHRITQLVEDIEAEYGGMSDNTMSQGTGEKIAEEINTKFVSRCKYHGNPCYHDYTHNPIASIGKQGM